MNLKLMLASKWIPQRVIKQELLFIAESTISLLNILLREHDLATAEPIRIQKNQSPDRIRENMALIHVLQTRRLMEHIGHKETLARGRERLYALGQRIGGVFKNQFNIGDHLGDAQRAVQIMYKILQIKFHIQWISPIEAHLDVKHCSLARFYGEHTCALLCAADEGVINGINNALTMKFKNHLTQGHPFCRAELHYTPCTEQVLCRL
ncbi:MAG: L-2-amino-thiazoline-4-carboxylic acid hydrolase [Spirochaetales bacterium]|nr:L-2-amino-thiazoline-4-carboxylic acid hydrolase [Spirochaetales bacterium]